MWYEYLFFVCTGFLGNFVGTMVGGGALITLPAMMLFGVPVHTGIGVNKFATIVTGCANSWRLITEKRISKYNFLFTAILGFTGGLTGALITANTDAKILNWFVIILLTFSLAISFMKAPKKTSSDPQEDSLRRFSPRTKLIVFGISIYNGGFGPGAGTLSIMTLLRRGYPYIGAVHHTWLLIATGCLGAFGIFLQHGFINWHYAIPLSIGGIIGAQAGFLALPYVPQRAVRVGLAVVSLLLIIQTFFKVI